MEGDTMTVFVLTYFYPGGVFAGIIGAYTSPERAAAAERLAKYDYSDCTFVTTEVAVQ
jgi:hypothetical protein